MNKYEKGMVWRRKEEDEERGENNNNIRTINIGEGWLAWRSQNGGKWKNTEYLLCLESSLMELFLDTVPLFKCVLIWLPHTSL